MLTQSQPDWEAHLQPEQIDGLVEAAGIDAAREIFAAFSRSTAELLAALHSQLDAGALAEAAKSAHAVKGSAANVGAVRISETAAQLEVMCKNGDGGAAPALLEQAKRDFDAFDACCNAYLDGK